MTNSLQWVWPAKYKILLSDWNFIWLLDRRMVKSDVRLSWCLCRSVWSCSWLLLNYLLHTQSFVSGALREWRNTDGCGPWRKTGKMDDGGRVGRKSSGKRCQWKSSGIVCAQEDPRVWGTWTPKGLTCRLFKVKWGWERRGQSMTPRETQ